MRFEDVKSIGIVGAGVMGSGISQVASLAGYQVICRDLTEAILEKAKDNIVNGRFGLKSSLERGKITREQMEQALANLTLTTKLEDLRDCDVIIEAIGGGDSGEIENKALKLKVFAELDKLVKKDAIFASNASFITIADLAAVTVRKDRFAGMHWYSPASLMKAVEVICTAEVSEEAIRVIEGLCRKCGKTGVRVRDVPGDTGFVGNRIFFAAVREAEKIVASGIATADDVDTIMMLGFNWPMGPMAVKRRAYSS